MIFKARIYGTQAQADLAYERLVAVEARLPIKDRLLLKVTIREDEVVVLIHKAKDKDIERIKDGHWVGGERYVLTPEEMEEFSALAKKEWKKARDSGDTTVDKNWSPNEQGILDDEGNVK